MIIVSAGVLAAACFACVPPSPPPPPVGVVATVPTCTGGSSFLSHVQYLASGYDPTNYATAPPPGSAIDSSSPYAAALQNAFQLAPQAFRNHLCGLGGIYINGAACSDFDSCFTNSWGYRAKKDKKGYIAISAGLWSSDRLSPYTGATSYAYHLYETDVLNSLLGFSSSVSYRPQYTAANVAADNFDMTILAALAHELGHVRWYEVLGPATPGGDYHPNSFCLGADGSTFFSNSWASPVHKPPRWRVFLNRSARGSGHGSSDSHLATPQISTIDRYINSGDMNYASYLIDQIYQAGAPWASYFAAIAPDEDFVETYKLYVLMNAQSVAALGEGPLTYLKVQINNGLGQAYTENIPDNYANPADHSGKPLLAAKMTCIANSM